MNLFFSVEEVKILREVVCVREAYQYASKGAVEGWDETSVRRAAALVYQNGLDAALFLERAAKTGHRRYSVLREF